MRLNRSALLVASLAKAEIDPDFFRDVQRSTDMAPAIERPFNFQVKILSFFFGKIKLILQGQIERFGHARIIKQIYRGIRR